MRYYLILLFVLVLSLPACTVKQAADITLNVTQQPAISNIYDNLTVKNAGADMLVMPRGTPDPDWYVDVYQPELVWPGTTLFADNHNPDSPRIVEVNMLGEIIWQYVIPQHLRQYNNPGFHTELLPGGNILFVLPRNGVYEIDRSGTVLWSYINNRISHDAHRLHDGNTIFACGAADQKDEVQVRVVDPRGQVVWSWYARYGFDKTPYNNIYEEGWTHINAVKRLQSGNTIISLRNFGLVVEVDTKGSIVRSIGEGIFDHQHDPELLPGGNILTANHSQPQKAIEIDPVTNEIVWQYAIPQELLRDADRLPNGNTLITGASTIVEVTHEKTIAWRLKLRAPLEKTQAPALGFYKSERIGIRNSDR